MRTNEDGNAGRAALLGEQGGTPRKFIGSRPVIRAPASIWFALILAACGSGRAGLQSINPLLKAEEYARTHYPEVQVPKGKDRAWLVEDHGDTWTVELFKQGQIGGGIKMVVLKRDGTVIEARLTE
jgi:hypothetical protein